MAEVENARESVRNGVIQGIRSSDTFQGSISSRLIHLPTWNPYSDPVLIAFKAVFPIFPEPEIYYRAGTDIRLETTTAFSLPDRAISDELVPQNTAPTEELDHLVSQLPARVVTRKDVDADMINLVFIGSASMVRSAFLSAGWRNSDPVSRRSVMKNLYALLNNNGYAQQPMRTFYLDGRPEDMNWQKSLNSYDRRDHLRIWSWQPTGSPDPVWISSSTRDTGAVLAVKQKGFIHHIASDIDQERSAVIRDLSFAGCVESVHYVSRSDFPVSVQNATGDVMHTDNFVGVVNLKDCNPTVPQPAGGPEQRNYRPGNHLFRFARRQILTFRNDIFRANIIYGSYEGTRMAITALRHPNLPAPVETASQYAPAHEAFTSLSPEQTGSQKPLRKPLQLRTIH
ncbi:LssY C-terminal domain-containing protein [Edaphobacter sp. HDX4]|uniref:LssY C-terminal domain-containing protein n=1 Tax=Edaphobacter sp. HDX4 TaxID=2794064 RepID=UPI002FE68BD8